MATSSIEWTNQTWNPVVGCTWASAGCDHCYAATMTRRLEAMGQADYAGLTSKKHFNGTVRTLASKLDIPLWRKKPTTYFVNSMSDLFHKDVPFEFIDRVFAVMALCPHHTFQILTKRPERMAEWANRSGAAASVQIAAFKIRDEQGCRQSYAHMFDAPRLPLGNVWMGCSVENQATADERIPHLLRVPAAVRFLSCEPLLGAVDLTNDKMRGGDWNWLTGESYDWSDGTPAEDKPRPGINWVIIGGESGPKARPCDIAWVRSLVSQCKAAGVAAFVKQLGAYPVDAGGRHALLTVGSTDRSGAINCVMSDDGGGECESYPTLRLKDRKGGAMSEWPEDLRVREMPIAK